MKRTLVLLTLLAGVSTVPSHADPAGQLAVTAVAPATAACDVGFEVTGRVTAAGSYGVPRQTVRIAVDGSGVGYGSTDDTGAYTVSVAGTAPGEHVVGADIYGGSVLDTESTPTTIEITGDCEQP